MSETSALQGLSRLLLAHQDSESGAEVMRETRETRLHLARPASQSLPQGRGGESLDQEQKSHIAARVSLPLFLDAERFVLTPEIAANKTTPEKPPCCSSDTWQQAEPPHRAGWGRRFQQGSSTPGLDGDTWQLEGSTYQMSYHGQSFLNVFPRPGWLKVTHRNKTGTWVKSKEQADSLIVMGKAEVTALDVLD